MTATPRKFKCRETYSLLNNNITGIFKWNAVDGVLSIDGPDVSDAGLLEGCVNRIGDFSSCYLDGDNKTIVVKPPYGANVTWNEIEYRSFNVSCSISSEKIIRSRGSYKHYENPLYLRSYDAPNLSKIVMSNKSDDSFKNDITLPVNIGASDTIRHCITTEAWPRINAISIPDLFREMGLHYLSDVYTDDELLAEHPEGNEIKFIMRVKDISFDIDWISYKSTKEY